MNDPGQAHPSLQQLEALDRGQLDLTAWAEVEDHVAYCEACCTKLEMFPVDPLVLLLRSAVGTPWPQPADTGPGLDQAASREVVPVPSPHDPRSCSA